MERNKNRNVFQEYSTLWSSGIQSKSSFFFLHRGNPLCTRCLYFEKQALALCRETGEISSALQVHKSIQSRPLDWSSVLEIPFVFLKATRSPNCCGDQLFHAGKAASPSSPILPVSAVRKEIDIFSEYFRTSWHPERGAGVCCPSTIQVLRLRPWGTRVPPSQKLRLKPGTDPRWCTGRPAPDT